jgi:SRSO17 transposase
MTADPVEAIGPAWTAFLQPFERFFDSPKTVRHFRAYSRGLLSDLPRKTAEPLALHAGTPPRCLQPFLKVCLWDHAGLVEAVGGTLRTTVVALPADPVGTVGLLDETSSVKQGTKTPGVQRPYLGCVGKVEKGIVTVHLAVVHGSFKALLDGELFLPQAWDADRPRCREADIPDEVCYRPKWRIGLELHAHARDRGWSFDGLTFDEGDGGKPDFLSQLDTAGQTDGGEVPQSFSCRRGRGPVALSAEAVFARPGVRRRAAKAFRMPPQTGPDAVWQAKAVAVRLGVDRRSRHRLIVARNRQTGEVKYFLTNASRRIGLRRVLRAAFVRWNVEPVFRVAKSEIGLTHFEGRSYVSLKRHLALCLLARAFVALHTMRLRGKNPAVTLEQVCRTLAGIGRRYFRRRRGTKESECLLDVLNYHQDRNATAKRSRRKRPRRLRRFTAL